MVLTPTAHIRKIATLPPKSGCWSIDDTDSSSDEDCADTTSTVDPYLQEWNLYLNTNEAVPDDVGIVQWWGVRTMFLFPVPVSP